MPTSVDGSDNYLTTRNTKLQSKGKPHGQIVMQRVELKNPSGETISTGDYNVTTSSSGSATVAQNANAPWYKVAFLSQLDRYWATGWGLYDYNEDGTSYYIGNQNTGGVSGEWIQIENNTTSTIYNIVLTFVPDNYNGHNGMQHEPFFDLSGNVDGVGDPIGTSQPYNIQLATSNDGINWKLERLHTAIIPRTTISNTPQYQISTYSLYNNSSAS